MEQKEEIRNLLKIHDVYFEFAEDHRHWLIGNFQKNKILQLINDSKISFDEAMDLINENIDSEEIKLQWKHSLKHLENKNFKDFELKVMLQFKDLDSRNYFKFREFLRKAYEMGKGER